MTKTTAIAILPTSAINIEVEVYADGYTYTEVFETREEALDFMGLYEQWGQDFEVRGWVDSNPSYMD